MTHKYFRKKHYAMVVLALLYTLCNYGQIIITGVFDGPLPGGLPKGVELYVTEDVSDLSIFALGSANNGGGTNGPEFTFPSVPALSGEYIYVASEAIEFNNFFGISPNYTSGAVNINGDDAIELFKSGLVIDVFGDINTDGTGLPWEYLDGWAYRKSTTGPDGASFTIANWSFSGINALDGETLNGTASARFPIGSYTNITVTDTEAPSAPTHLVAENITSTTTDLLWTASSDNIGVKEYQIFNGTILIAVSTQTNYTINNLIPNTTYSFSVRAVDAANNVSSASNSISVLTLNDVAPPVEAYLLITGVIDGPLSGGVPKAIELYAIQDISDLSIYAIGSANNGGGTDGEEFKMFGTAKAGDFIYIASEEAGFLNFFGFSPNFVSGAAAINGDDAIELFLNGTVVDVFGEINTDGTGTPWDYMDGWASRKDNTGPDGTVFNIDNWVFSGTNALDGATDNALAAAPFPLGAYGPDLLITGVIDGPLSGGVPKAIELYAKQDIADLSIYGFGSANNGGGSDGVEFTLTGSAKAGDFIYVASEAIGFLNFFGFSPNFISSAAAINGDDAIELFYNGQVIDVFGDINVDGSGQEWDYLDGWAYRVDNTGPDGQTFVIANWSFSGPNALNGTTINTTFPIGTYGGGVTEPLELISIAAARAKPEGALVKVTGILTVADEFSGSAYLQDSTGGIAIFDQLVHGDGLFKIGDSITVTGTRSAFNNQIQISPVTEVENNGLPSFSIEPKIVTLAELAMYPGELVKVLNPKFPKPGDILFGNSNYILTDASGSGELRIDNDVETIVGLGQPENCDMLLGVVGRFQDIYQLLPRQKSDIPCADAYMPPLPPIMIPKEKTLDVVTWNIEWFGDGANAPSAGNSMSDTIQKESVKQVINKLGADVIAVQEISDDVLFDALVKELPGYGYVLSPAVSRPDEPGVKQKIGFIYKTETIKVTDTKVLLESIHPLYNGGNDTALVNYPSTTDRFYASGRLPFLMTADVSIDGDTETYNFIALHARANNSSDPEGTYNMRKYDVEVLKDSLDVQYAKANIVLLGDYNDDVDVTVADVATSTSTYTSYIQDKVNYNIVTGALSAGGFRSFVSRDNMIDHISISNELNDNFIAQSERVHYEFYNNNYTNTTSDHLPVSARLLIKPLTLTALSYTEKICFGVANGAASVLVSGGLAPYIYAWSGISANTANISNLSFGDYTVTVTDALGGSLTESFTITEFDKINITTTENTTVYKGYEPQSCTQIAVVAVNGGTAPYTYLWSTGETSKSIRVCPEQTNAYTVLITDANGCTNDAIITVSVVNVSCGPANNAKVSLCFNDKTLCVDEHAVAPLLAKGAVLGACNANAMSSEIYKVAPNPFVGNTNVWLTTDKTGHVQLYLYSAYGELLKVYTHQVNSGTSKIELNLTELKRGFYYLKTKINGNYGKTKVLLKN